MWLARGECYPLLQAVSGATRYFSFQNCPHRLRGTPSLNGCRGYLPRGKQPGRDVDPLPQLTPRWSFRNMPSWHEQEQIHLFAFPLRLCEQLHKKGTDKAVSATVMKVYRGVEVQLYSFLTYALGGGEESTSSLDPFALRKEPPFPLNRKLCGTKCRLEVLVKSYDPCGDSNPGVPSPLRSYCTELLRLLKFVWYPNLKFIVEFFVVSINPTERFENWPFPSKMVHPTKWHVTTVC